MNYENLYFTGSSAHPGAGVPIVLNSAKLAAAELLRDAGLPEPAYADEAPGKMLAAPRN